MCGCLQSNLARGRTQLRRRTLCWLTIPVHSPFAFVYLYLPSSRLEALCCMIYNFRNNDFSNPFAMLHHGGWTDGRTEGLNVFGDGLTNRITLFTIYLFWPTLSSRALLLLSNHVLIRRPSRLETYPLQSKDNSRTDKMFLRIAFNRTMKSPYGMRLRQYQQNGLETYPCNENTTLKNVSSRQVPNNHRN